ncbi:MAG: hypothetical protein M9931_01740 [Chitinophagales bacterium]|nr:hypothetical protein [Chitinophagales bacterium]MCO5279759.1 hypothetical protein [Chitinophagales bacterium]OJV24342.1 MAG: hypothetical protein BGO32_12985 [Bacteroidetes bacterium 37-13]HRN93262.1 hypothetical protein [Chitinophagales bacterium]HRP40286.1 hypothetical protein [Chitinophagales bacterium]
MNKKLRLPLFGMPLLITILFAVASCTKENKAPVITFEEPEAGTITTIPNETHIEGSVTDDDGLKDIRVYVFNTAMDTLMNEYLDAAGAKEKRFHYHYMATIAGSYTATVAATDLKGVSATKSVKFTVAN